MERSGSSRFDDGARAAFWLAWRLVRSRRHSVVASGHTVSPNADEANAAQELCAIDIMTDAKFGDTVCQRPSPHTGHAMLRSLVLATAFLGSLIIPATAQSPLRSECLAMANAPPRATPVSLRRTAAKAEEVAITYVGHSTYYIDTPGGVRIGDRFQRLLPDRAAARRRHHEPRAFDAFHAVSRSQDQACAARLGREGAARAGRPARRRRLYPQRAPPTSAATTAMAPAAR